MKEYYIKKLINETQNLCFYLTMKNGEFEVVKCDLKLGRKKICTNNSTVMVIIQKMDSYAYEKEYFKAQ